MPLQAANTAAADRTRIRAGEHTGPTSGLAPGFALFVRFEWALTAAGQPVAHQAQGGIDDLAAPDFRDPARVGAEEEPVFWGCGVTPQAVAIEARPSLAIFQAPGHMFVTDRRHIEFDTLEEGHDHS